MTEEIKLTPGQADRLRRIKAENARLDRSLDRLYRKETRKQRKARTRGTTSVIAVCLAAVGFVLTMVIGLAALAAAPAWLMMLCLGPLVGWGFLTCWVLLFFMIGLVIWSHAPVPKK